MIGGHTWPNGLEGFFNDTHADLKRFGGEEIDLPGWSKSWRWECIMQQLRHESAAANEAREGEARPGDVDTGRPASLGENVCYLK